MKRQILCSKENKKNIICLSSASSAHGVLIVKVKREDGFGRVKTLHRNQLLPSHVYRETNKMLELKKNSGKVKGNLFSSESQFETDNSTSSDTDIKEEIENKCLCEEGQVKYECTLAGRQLGRKTSSSMDDIGSIGDLNI